MCKLRKSVGIVLLVLLFYSFVGLLAWGYSDMSINFTTFVFSLKFLVKFLEGVGIFVLVCAFFGFLFLLMDCDD